MIQSLYDSIVYYDLNRPMRTSRGTGTLRRDVNDIPVDTKVVVDGDFHVAVGSKFSDQRQVFVRSRWSVGLGGAARLTVRPVRF